MIQITLEPTVIDWTILYIKSMITKMMQYMNLVMKECLQAEGQTAQVVLTQDPVRQQARLLMLKMPPILLTFYCEK